MAEFRVKHQEDSGLQKWNPNVDNTILEALDRNKYANTSHINYSITVNTQAIITDLEKYIAIISK